MSCTVAGHALTVAIECRGHARTQTVDWIDSLIGKYRNLPVDKIVAVSATRFSAAAYQKAELHGIELLTAQEASGVDWAAVLVRPWKLLTHSFTLMRVMVIGLNDEVLAQTDVDASGLQAVHRDEFSEQLYEGLRLLFFDQYAAQTAAGLEAKIEQRWQAFVDDPTPKYAETTVTTKPGATLTLGEHNIPISKVVFGIGTFFEVVEQTPTARVLKERLVQSLSHPSPDRDLRLQWVVNQQGALEAIKLIGD